MATQHTVVAITVVTSATCDDNPCPCRARISSTTDTASELSIATTSHQALTRHQNQRAR